MRLCVCGAFPGAGDGGLGRLTGLLVAQPRSSVGAGGCLALCAPLALCGRARRDGEMRCERMRRRSSQLPLRCGRASSRRASGAGGKGEVRAGLGQSRGRVRTSESRSGSRRDGWGQAEGRAKVAFAFESLTDRARAATARAAGGLARRRPEEALDCGCSSHAPRPRQLYRSPPLDR